MEILAEIAAALIGFLVEALFEIFAQIVAELLAEIGLRSLAAPFKRSGEINPILAGVGYSLYGAIVGGLSLFLPRVFTAPTWMRLLNLLITPIACGLIMAYVGKVRARRGDVPLRMDTFMYAYLFALAMAIVRYVWR
jgi:hypothetical protein